MANLVRILPMLALTRFDDSLPDREADGWEIVDLRKWSKPSDPWEDSGKLFRHANAVAACIKSGQKVLLVDDAGTDRVSLAAAAALVALGRSGPSAYQAVLDANPQAFSGLPDRQKVRWQQFIESLDPITVKNVKPAPKPAKWNITVNETGETPYTNRYGNQS